MKPFTTPLRLLTLPAWLVPRVAHDRREPGLETERPSTLPRDGPPSRSGRQAPTPPLVPLSRDEIELALDAGTQRHFPPRGEAEVMRGH